jgi:hypothetical protein
MYFTFKFKSFFSIPHSTAVKNRVRNTQFADFLVRIQFVDFPPLILAGFLYTT